MEEPWTGENINKLIREQLDLTGSLLTERGNDYGPLILKQLGIEYPIFLIIAKSLRLQWQWKTHRQVHWDSVRDIVGYGILALVQGKLEQEKETEG